MASTTKVTKIAKIANLEGLDLVSFEIIVSFVVYACDCGSF